MSIADKVEALRRLLMESARPEEPVIDGPVTAEVLSDLDAALGHPIPDELRQPWSISAGGYWTLVDELFSPEYSVEMTLLWRDILREWPISDNVPIRTFVAFTSPLDIGCLYLVDGPVAGGVVLIDPQDAGNPTLLARSLEDYLDREIDLVRSRGVDLVMVPSQKHGRSIPVPQLRPEP